MQLRLWTSKLAITISTPYISALFSKDHSYSLDLHVAWVVLLGEGTLVLAQQLVVIVHFQL